jgi:hypothetical protein
MTLKCLRSSLVSAEQAKGRRRAQTKLKGKEKNYFTNSLITMCVD